MYYFTVLFLVLFSMQSWFSPVHAEGSLLEGLEAAKQDFYRGDLDQALVKFQALQHEAGSEADYYLALIHLRKGKHRDIDLALTLLRRASSEEYPPAMRALGTAYERGEGVKADLLKALDWYRKADALEHPGGVAVQFYASHDGTLAEQTVHQQIQRLKSAAADGDLGAAYQLAKLHDVGGLMMRNPEQALHWYRVAAESGHAHSRLMLGYFLCRGIATPRNVDEADHWLELSGRKASCSGESIK